MTVANEHERQLAFQVLEGYFGINKTTNAKLIDVIDHEAQRERAVEKFRFLVEMRKFDLAYPPKKNWFPWKITIVRR